MSSVNPLKWKPQHLVGLVVACVLGAGRHAVLGATRPARSGHYGFWSEWLFPLRQANRKSAGAGGGRTRFREGFTRAIAPSGGETIPREPGLKRRCARQSRGRERGGPSALVL